MSSIKPSQKKEKEKLATCIVDWESNDCVIVQTWCQSSQTLGQAFGFA